MFVLLCLTALLVAPSSVRAAAAGEGCEVLEDCDAGLYCDSANQCYACEGCFTFRDAIGLSTGVLSTRTCPERCFTPTPEAECAYEAHCEEGQFCKEGQCTGCDDCEDDLIPGPFTCDQVCPVGECSIHEQCNSNTYCDTAHSCYPCEFCDTFNDAIDGQCPDKCSSEAEPTTESPTGVPVTDPIDTTPECESQDACGDNEYCDNTNRCFECSNCYAFRDALEGDLCPEKCRNNQLECQYHPHCGEYEYCSDTNTCQSCAVCSDPTENTKPECQICSTLTPPKTSAPVEPEIVYNDATELTDGFVLHWSCHANTIDFKLEVQDPSGYIGFGIASTSTGGMPGSDIAIATRNLDGWELTDRKAQGRFTPALDASDDLMKKTFTESDGSVQIAFSRLRDTGDANDNVIGTGPVGLIWALGNSDSLSYHFANRGKKTVELCAVATTTEEPADTTTVGEPEPTVSGCQNNDLLFKATVEALLIENNACMLASALCDSEPLVQSLCAPQCGTCPGGDCTDRDPESMVESFTCEDFKAATNCELTGGPLDQAFATMIPMCAESCGCPKPQTTAPVSTEEVEETTGDVVATTKAATTTEEEVEETTGDVVLTTKAATTTEEEVEETTGDVVLTTKAATTTEEEVEETTGDVVLTTKAATTTEEEVEETTGDVVLTTKAATTTEEEVEETTEDDGSGDGSGEESTTIEVIEGTEVNVDGTPGECQLENCFECDLRGVECFVCKNAYFLHEGACVEECPHRYTPAGRGNFNKVCRAPTCEAGVNGCAECSSNHQDCVRCEGAYGLDDNECVMECPLGQKIMDNMCVEAECTVGKASCNKCNPDRTWCMVCSGGTFLTNGTCEDTCEFPNIATGRGNFGRKCTAPTPKCFAGIDGCATCHHGQQSCSVCQTGMIMDDGQCIATCPDSHAPEFDEVTGNLICVEQNFACTPAKNSCFACNSDRTECAMCYRGQFLFEGHCIEECPENHEARGAGSFGLFCDKTFLCEKGRDSCHTCNEAQTHCVKCSGGKKLFNGNCQDTCPTGYVTRGRGNFGLFCSEVPTECQPGRKNCHTCHSDGSGCRVCSNGRYLHDGVCVETCPEGTTGRGSGRFRRFCE